MVALLLLAALGAQPESSRFLFSEAVEMADIYQNTNTATVAGVSTIFDLTKKTTLDLDFSVSKSFKGTLKGLWIYISNAASSPTTISIMITTDATGDEILIPETESSISFGLTTATKGSASFFIDQPMILRGQESIYVFCKTDAGTVQIDKVVLSWES
jgi:hypothetical protein